MKYLYCAIIILFAIITFRCKDYSFNNTDESKITPPTVPATPVPSDAAVDQVTEVTLCWECSSPDKIQVKYDIYLDKENPPKAQIASSHPEKTFKAAGLSQNTTYYWQIKAKDEKNNIAQGPVWKFKTGTVPSGMTLLSPTDQAKDIPLPPTLTWNGISGASSYNLQVSGNNSFTDLKQDMKNLTATSIQVPGLENGKAYFWRVSAVNSFGTSEWSGVFSFTTSNNNPPGTPTYISPQDNAVNQEVNVTINWKASTDPENEAVSYDVYLDENNPPKLKKSSLQSQTSYNVTGLTSGITYYWQIFAKDSYGNYTNGPVWNFTVKGQRPILAFPGNGEAKAPINPELSWNPCRGAASYQLQVSKNNSFTDLVYNEDGLTVTKKLIPNLAYDSKYYWRIRAYNTREDFGWSDIWSFSTEKTPGSKPAAPVLLSPAAQAKDISLTPTLTWNASNGASSYTLQVSTRSDFSSYFYEKREIPGTSQNVPGLSYSAVYFWRVNAVNSFGTSDWSEVRSFTTISNLAPQQPRNPIPADNAQNQALSLSLGWACSDPESDPLTYDIYLGITNNPSLVKSQTASNYNPGPLNTNTTYYWKIVAKDNYNNSTPGPVWKFTTSGTVPQVPALILPNNGESGIPVNPYISWYSSEGADSYNLEIARNSSFTSSKMEYNNLNSTSITISDLSYNTQYWWRVNAANNVGTSDWSEVRSFTTLRNVAPRQPSSPFPGNYEKDQQLSLTMSWKCTDPENDPITYDVYFGTSSPPPLKQNQSSNIYNPGSLEPGKTYYWKIVANDNYGNTIEGPVWSFTTKNNSTEVLGLVAFYPFHGSANDLSGKGNNGIVYGATPTTNRFGSPNKAYNFNGSSDILVPNSESLGITNSFTISVWVYPTSLNSHNMIISKHKKDNNSDGSWQLFIGGDARVSFSWGTGTWNEVLSKRQIPLNQWTHIVFTYSVFTDDYKFFIDGNLDTETSVDVKILPTNDNLFIGSEDTGSGRRYYFKGKLDDIKIYNRSLPNSEIRELYNEGD